MQINKAIILLIKDGVDNDSWDSAVTAYAMAIGTIPASDKTTWSEINSQIPSHSLEKTKKMAWEKYNAIVDK